MGIAASTATVERNVLSATNYGNSVANAISLASSTLSGGSVQSGGASVSSSSTQDNSLGLTATLSGSTVGVSVGAVSAGSTVSSAATGTASRSATANNDADYRSPPITGDWVNDTSSGATGSASPSASADTNATATATGIAGTTLNVLSNQLSAVNFANSADNSIALSGTVLGTVIPVTVALSNEQSNSGDASATASTLMLGVRQGAVSATASGSASVNTGSGGSADANSYAYGVINSNISVGGSALLPQTIRAESVGNSASNTIAISDATGSGSSGSATLYVENTQFNSGELSALVGATGIGAANVSVGLVVGAVSSSGSASGGDWWANGTAVGVSGSNVAVQSNQLTALTYANSATNRITSATSNALAGSTAGTATAEIRNEMINEGATSSTLARVDVGVVLGNVTVNAYDLESATSITGSTLNVSANTLTAASYGNGANNTLGIGAQSPGSSALPLGTQLYTSQGNSGGQTALIDSARVGIVTGATSADDESVGITGSTLTVSRNHLDATTYGNSAGNSNSVTAANTAYLGNLVTSNDQYNRAGGSGSSTLSNAAVGVLGGSVNGWDAAFGLRSSPSTVQSNQLSASSYGNYATNITSASGGNALYSGAGVSGFNLLTDNVQRNDAAMDSNASAITVGVAIDSVGSVGDEIDYATGIANSALSVSSNSLTARSVGNSVTNTTALNSAIGGVTAKVANKQTNNGALSATIGDFSGDTSVTVGVRLQGVDGNYEATGISGGSVTVQSNQLNALSYANSASNTLTSTSSNSLAGAVPDTPIFRVSNEQINSGPSSAKLTGVSVGSFVGAVSTHDYDETAYSIVGSPQNVSSNTLTAVSYGNGVSNAIAVSAQSPGLSATPVGTVLGSLQSNYGDQSARVENTQVGVVTGTTYTYDGTSVGISGSALTVSSNVLAAATYGNSAGNSNSVTAGNSAYLDNLVTGNTQSNGADGDGSSTLSNVSVGVVGGTVNGWDAIGLSSSPSTVQSNQLSASSYGNYATNVTSASGGNALLRGAGTAGDNLRTSNLQYNYGAMDANASAITLGVAIGSVGGQADSATGIGNSALTVNANSLTVRSVGNSATSLAELNSAIGGVTAAVSNEQTNTGVLTASIGAVGDATSVTVGVRTQSVHGDSEATGVSGGGVTVQSNQLNALSYANSASNTLTSASSNSLAGATNAAFGVLNTQTNTGGGTSRLDRVDVGSFVGAVSTAGTNETAYSIVGSPQNVSSNALTAVSYGNGASNAIAVTAQAAGSEAVPLGTKLVSTQTNTVGQTAVVDHTQVGVFTDHASTTSGDTVGISGSGLTVNSNVLAAESYGNSAGNSNSVVTSNSAYLGGGDDNKVLTDNTQNNYGGDGASTLSHAAVGVSVGAVSSDDGTGLKQSPTAVHSNALSASSFGNYATNATTVSAGNALEGSSGVNLLTSNTQENVASMDAYAHVISVGVLSAQNQANNATAISASALSVNSNSVSARSIGNSATNSVALSGATVAVAGSVANDQANHGALTAEVAGVQVGVVTSLVGGESSSAVGISGGAVAVQSNQLSALSYANSASNTLSASGSNSLERAATAYRVDNLQANTSATQSTLRDADVGVVLGSDVGVVLGSVSANTAVSISASPQAVSANTLTAASYGNGASNLLSVTAQTAGSSGTPLGTTVSSDQENHGDQTALVDEIRVGVVTAATAAYDSSATAIANSALAVSGNRIEALSYGNSAGNGNSVAVANSADLGAVFTNNDQYNTGDGASTLTDATVGVRLGDVSSNNGTRTGLSSAPTSVSANQLSATSYGNFATNSTSASGGNVLSGGELSGGAAANLKATNSQENQGTMSASGGSIAVGVFTGQADNGIVGSAVAVSANAVSATSYGNQASNSVSATAGDALNGTTVTQTALVQSSQVNHGNTSSALNTVQVGVFTNASTDVSGSAVTVDGNRLTAASYANSVSNTLSLNAPTLGASGTVVTGKVDSTQSNTASGSGTISSASVGLMPSDGSSGALILNGVTGVVSNNALNAQAGGNTATNALNATAVATIAGNGTTTPNFQVLNTQSNSGVMLASISNGLVGNWGNANSSYTGPSTLSVSMNVASANAYGNTASNALNMSALTGSSNAATAAIGNSQSNSANLTATVSNTLIGVGTGYSNGVIAVANNSISASTVGNAVSNSIGIKK